MAFNPLLLSAAGNADLRVRSDEPGYERVQALNANGNVSAYGCGWNVLFLLGVITRDEAQEGVNAIVADHDNDGNHPGLLLGNVYMPASMAGILRARGLPHQIVSMRMEFEHFGRDRELIREWIINHFFPQGNFAETLAPGQTHFYIVIKYLIDLASGLGHSVLFSFDLHDGRWFVNVIDAQLKRYNGFDETIDYVLAPQRNYVGLECLGHMPPLGGKRKSRSQRKYRSKRKLRRKQTRRGGANRDPEMKPMSKEDDEKYVKMIQDLEAQPIKSNSSVFVYDPRDRPANNPIVFTF
jgi:hypothetical protein